MHKEFKKAVGANCIFLHVASSELYILVRFTVNLGRGFPQRWA